jgi:signal transduction histidine kinase
VHTVDEQVDIARRQVDRHLARARAAGASRRPGARVPVAPVLDGLARAMARVHAERGVTLGRGGDAPQAAFAGDEQDLHELLGNLIDNAFKWARHHVQVSVDTAPDDQGAWLRVTVDDDGPGLAPDERERVRARGARIDESMPGSGLGLAIVDELVALYGGRMVLDGAPTGGLRVSLTLPAVAPGPGEA